MRCSRSPPGSSASRLRWMPSPDMACFWPTYRECLPDIPPGSVPGLFNGSDLEGQLCRFYGLAACRISGTSAPWHAVDLHSGSVHDFHVLRDEVVILPDEPFRHEVFFFCDLEDFPHRPWFLSAIFLSSPVFAFAALHFASSTLNAS